MWIWGFTNNVKGNGISLATTTIEMVNWWMVEYSDIKLNWTGSIIIEIRTHTINYYPYIVVSYRNVKIIIIIIKLITMRLSITDNRWSISA